MCIVNGYESELDTQHLVLKNIEFKKYFTCVSYVFAWIQNAYVLIDSSTLADKHTHTVETW